MTADAVRPDASAAELDAADPLAGFRERFELPEGIYFVGNSLGAMPKTARAYISDELDRWATIGVEGHFTGKHPWKDYHTLMAPAFADLVGGSVDEVVAMNALTVNLHLLLMSFYQPTVSRHKILIEEHAFPSDHFVVESQIRQRGFDPSSSLVTVAPRPGEEVLHPADIAAAIADHGDSLALVLLPGVQYYTGQVLPMADITAAAHDVGAYVGFDLAHAVGNIELHLHDWNVDFAAWCTYKYVNSGPGGVAGAFVHRSHVSDQSLPKLLGWWGNDPATRFAMDTTFDPVFTAESWQLSNAPIVQMAALRAALEVIVDAGGMSALRNKSVQQIQFFDHLLANTLGDRVTNITPRPLSERGCQFALQVRGGAGRVTFEALEQARVFCDWREPDVIRVAPVPLYNTFAEIERFVEILDGIVQ